MILGILRGIHKSHLTSENYQEIEKKDELITSYFIKKGTKAVYFFLEDFDSETQKFKRSWKYIGGKFLELKTKHQPSLIRNMDEYHTHYIHDLLSYFPVICSSHLSHISDNKLTTHEFLGSFQPRTVILQSFLANKHIQNQFGDILVIKPIFGRNGIGIKLLKKHQIVNNIPRRTELENVFIVQEYIDSTLGHPLLTPSVHDLRVYFVGNTITQSILSEISDQLPSSLPLLGSSGKGREIDISKLPSDLIKICEDIVETLDPQSFDYFSLDFMFHFNQNKRFLVETNSAPSFFTSTSERKNLGSHKVLGELYKNIHLHER